MKNIFIFFTLLTFSFSCLAKGNVENPKVQDRTISSYDIESTKKKENFMEEWGINKEEYERYLYLKNNTPRGYYTKGNNPLYILGAEARSAEERKKYARKVAKLEFENFVKIQSFTRATQLAHVELFGKGQMVDLNQGEKLKREVLKLAGDSMVSSFDINDFNPSDIALSKIIYVKPDCKPCEREYEKAYKDLMSGKIKQVQIVFPTENTNVIVNWAVKMEVPREFNQKGIIVLRGPEGDSLPDKYPFTKQKMIQ